jgi:hypothetical protein
VTPIARTVVLALAIVIVAVIGEWYVAALRGDDEITCRPQTMLTPLPQLPEASGVGISRRTPGLLWSFNDSDTPVLYGIDPAGNVKGQVVVAGAEVRDWEDVTVARCRRGSCLYIADIGDNDQKRSSITVYRVPEPSPDAGRTATAEAFNARYPDGPHDAEGLFITPEGGLFIITKDHPAAIYRFPDTIQTGVVMTLQQVTFVPHEKVTDAETTADGRWVALRTNEEIVVYPAQDLASGLTGNPRIISVKDLGEPQGEGIAVAMNGTVYLIGEGGGKGAAGTFAALRCMFPAGVN